MSIMYDSPIRFPGLFGDWAFTASSKAINIGAGIYWYGILIAIGAFIAAVVCLKQKEKYGITEDNLMDCILWGIPLGVIGARLYYVIFYLDLYRRSDGSLNWGRNHGIIAIWDGGLAIYGGVIAAVLVVYFISRRQHFKFFAMMDLVVIGLLIGQAVGRWGNFMNREAFGTETTLPWRMELTTMLGKPICVHPTFLYESLWNVIGLILILTIVSKARHFDGENTWFYCLWYGMGRFWIEGLRTDSLYLFDWTLFGEPIRVSQALSFALVLVGAFMLFYNICVHPHSSDELYVNQVAAKETTDEISAETADEPVESEEETAE